MKKLMAVLLLGVACMAVSSKAQAVSAAARGAKYMANVSYTTTVSSVSVSGPAAVYGVILGTGVAGTDYMAIFDRASIGNATVQGNTMIARIYASSTTQNTYVQFDPPLQFNSGIVAGNSTNAIWGTIIYEKGRVTNGN